MRVTLTGFLTFLTVALAAGAGIASGDADLLAGVLFTLALVAFATEEIIKRRRRRRSS